MSRQDTLWTRDRESVWAINSFARHRGQRPLPVVGDTWSSYGRTVIVGRVNKPWGRAVKSNPRKVVHLTSLVYTVWRRGEYRGAMVRWLCGGLSTEFVLDDRPWDGAPLCQVCLLRALGGVSVNINVVVEKGGRLRIG